MTRIVSRADALSRGITDSELQRFCRTRAWQRLRPGKFVSRTEFDALSPVDRHRVIAEAVIAASTAEDAVLSHVSAAVFHRLELFRTDLSCVHITRNRSSGGRRNRLRHVHAATYTEAEVVVIDGVRVTSIARTIADIARTQSFESAVCLADYAARTTGTTREDVNRVLDSCGNHPDNRTARRVAEFMNGLSESVGESRSRVLLAELGYEPQLQVRLTDDDGTFAFSDFGLLDFATVCEFDGKVKFGRCVPDNQLPSDVLWKEKIREDRIRSGGLQVVRWIWAELEHPEVIDRRIRAAAARAAKSPPPTIILG